MVRGRYFVDTASASRVNECNSFLEARPLVAGVVVLVVGALAWAGTSWVIRGTVEPLYTALFALGFGAVYLGFGLVGEGVTVGN